MAKATKKTAAVTEAPVEPLETAAPAKTDAELCWNCTNHGESNPLDAKGVCKVCGFSKGLLYNGDIEAAKAAERLAA